MACQHTPATAQLRKLTPPPRRSPPLIQRWLPGKISANSWEKGAAGGLAGYDLQVLRLSNSAIPGPKPGLFVMSSVHAREYAPAELNLRFAEYLVENYDTNPDVTWILDYTEILPDVPVQSGRAQAG